MGLLRAAIVAAPWRLDAALAAVCLIAFHWEPNGQTPLVVAANRDEFYARPALRASWWPQQNNGLQILAGQDVQAGGMWLGVDTLGRLATLTNYRDPARLRVDTRSRGELVSEFLHDSSLDAENWLNSLRTRVQDYNDFNLLIYDGKHLLGFESRNVRIVEPEPGCHALSNADFDTPWPKVQRLRKQMPTALHDEEELLNLLANPATAPDAELPVTGISRAREKALSAVFIETADYGTRASTIVQIGSGTVSFTERCFAPGVKAQTRRFSFRRHAVT